MRVISLSQPWAWVMMFGAKRVENRSWPAPVALYGQRIAMHAAKSWDAEAYEGLVEGDFGLIPGLPSRRVLCENLTEDGYSEPQPGFADQSRLPARACFVHGGIIGSFTLDHGVARKRDKHGQTSMIFTEEDERLVAPDQVRFFFGDYGHVYRDMTPLRRPIPFRGMQGYVNLTAAMADEVRALEER